MPAVAPRTCQDEIPDAVDRATPNLGPDRPSEDVVDLRLTRRGFAGGYRRVAVEARAFLVAVEGTPSTSNGGSATADRPERLQVGVVGDRQHRQRLCC